MQWHKKKKPTKLRLPCLFSYKLYKLSFLIVFDDESIYNMILCFKALCISDTVHYWLIYYVFNYMYVCVLYALTFPLWDHYGTIFYSILFYSILFYSINLKTTWDRIYRCRTDQVCYQLCLDFELAVRNSEYFLRLVHLVVSCLINCKKSFIA